MTNDQAEKYDSLKTCQERAVFLLQIGVTARTNIVDLDVVCQAKVGNVLLPVTAASEYLAIKKGAEWLAGKAVAIDETQV